MSLSSRIEREKFTVGVMIKMYCNQNHENDGEICLDCTDLAEFANERIDKCLYQDYKPVCSECEVHCYRKEMRDKIKEVMRFAGPRMIYQHPILGIRHLLDKKRFKYIDPKDFKSLKNN